MSVNLMKKLIIEKNQVTAASSYYHSI